MIRKQFISLILIAVLIFILIPTSFAALNYTFGDIDGNGQITAADALLALQFSVNKITLSDEQKTAGDVDLNKSITANDALMILQHSVGKITLTQPIDYDDYELKYVEPTGLTEYSLYSISSGSCFTDQDTRKNFDLTRLAVCIQGLINRNNDKHHVAVSLRMDDTDDFWLKYMMEDGATYADYNTVRIGSTDLFLSTFKDFIEECGIIAWDPDVPATANVASTICGLYNYLPVQYSTADGSLYKILTEDYDIPVKMNLCGMFENAKLGEKIKDTLLESTGSSKCDAYIWAMDKYMNECNPELLAYTLDGASAVQTNPVSQLPAGGTAQLTGIPSHDYFILRQCFFFDLTPYSLEQPNDDPDQPVGTDTATLKKLLLKRYNMAGGKFGMVLGFIPWHMKYTNYVGNYDLIPPRLEWLFIETISCYNCGNEADAPHPYWMSNASLYTKYQRRFEAKGNTAAKNITYDPDTYYYTVCYTGDFDCSPWIKWRVPTVWSDANRGSVDITYNYNVNVIDRVPMVYDYVFENQTASDYIAAGEGMGYVVTDALFKGFTGREANPDYKYYTGFNHTESGAATRTLPDGDNAYYEYAKPYYEQMKVDITGQNLNAFTPLSARGMNLINRLSSVGSFLQSSTAGDNDLQICNGVPYIRIFNISGDTLEDRVAWMYTNLKSRDSKFLALGYMNIGTNVGMPTEIKAFNSAFDVYMSWKNPNMKYQCVDIYTFFELIRQSGRGVQKNYN